MKSERSDLPRHPIRVVSRRTGLTPAVLRAWEKRYGVVVPERSQGGQRLYSDDDVRKLSLLRRAVDEGRAISQVAGLTSEELEGLVKEDEAERLGGPASAPFYSSTVEEILALAEKAVSDLDPHRLERLLMRSAMSLPVVTVLDEVLTPLLSSIGRSWREGRLGPGHEHLATVQIRRFLEWLLGTIGRTDSAPVMVTATAAGERHELGALMSAVSGAAEGWRTVFLGPDLPAEEIALAALRLGAQVVGLSSVDPRAAEILPGELRGLRNRLPSTVRVFVGGSAGVLKNGSLELLGFEGVEVLGSLGELRSRLRDLRVAG
jgi:MerR family transcriptional regulator, light-induced transcriptional regulator